MLFLLFLLVALCAVATLWPKKKDKAPRIPRQRPPQALTKWWSIRKEDLSGASHSSASSDSTRSEDRERNRSR